MNIKDIAILASEDMQLEMQQTKLQFLLESNPVVKKINTEFELDAIEKSKFVNINLKLPLPMSLDLLIKCMLEGVKARRLEIIREIKELANANERSEARK